MKKRILKVMLTALVAVSIAGCGGNKVSVSGKAKSVGKSVIGITDQYLDNDLGSQDALDQIDDLDLSFIDEEDAGGKTAQGDNKVKLSIASISHDIMLDANGSTTDTFDSIVNDRNDLADLVGESKR